VQDGASDEIQQRAANAYAVWPLAVLDLFREPPEATAWSRLHTRQAFVFGLTGTFAYLVLLALPLLLLIAIPPLGGSVTAVVWLYAVGLLADLVGAFVLFGLTMQYRERTLRGELFAIPVVTPIADRVFRLER
jgi:uncharacterized membrane protein